MLPYDDSLRRFPAYLQQLEMESNGKSVMQDGEPVECATAAVIWGEPGNNGQHSFFQLLHQGTQRAALDFLLPVAPRAATSRSRISPSPAAWRRPRPSATDNRPRRCARTWNAQDVPPARIAAAAPHKVHPGSRPSTIVLFQQLDPATLGRLIALYEHSVLTQSVVWGINAFDQWGVELGKKLCEQLIPAVQDPGGGHPAPAPIAKLLATVAKWRGGSMNRREFAAAMLAAAWPRRWYRGSPASAGERRRRVDAGSAPPEAINYPRTAAEVAANVTPESEAYAPLDLRRYGADASGSQSMRSRHREGDHGLRCKWRHDRSARRAYAFADQIDLAGQRSIIIAGEGASTGGAQAATHCTYTGADDRVFINMDSAVGCQLRGLQITHRDPHYTGTYITCGNVGATDPTPLRASSTA